MSAETVGMHMPPVVTLDDLAAMITADPHGHRYETSPEGALSVMPPPDSEHAAIASRLLVWLAIGGWPAEQVLQAAGVRIPGTLTGRTAYGGCVDVIEPPRIVQRTQRESLGIRVVTPFRGILRTRDELLGELADWLKANGVDGAGPFFLPRRAGTRH